MPSGGHPRSGPARDPNALRYGDRATEGFIKLTAPTNPPPAWPLLDKPSEREISIWNDLWSRPQATVWAQYNLTREVAVYARTLALFEEPGRGNAALGNLVRGLSDDLGLTIAGAARNKWLLPAADIGKAEVTPLRPVQPRRQSSRDRVKRAAPPTTPADDDRPPF
jgi:hypothetical protein